MEIRRGKKALYVIIAFVVIFGTFSGGAYFGYANRPDVEKVLVLFNKETTKPAEVDFSPFWTAWNTIESKYVSSKDIDSQEMVWGAVQGVVKSLGDPYSVFFPPEEAKMFFEDMNGNFEGVGMEIGLRKDILTVIAPLKDTPAFRAGIKAGDRVIKIDETSTMDMTLEQAVRLIRGEKGTIVTLTIFRDDEDEPLEIEITRDVINIPVLETAKKDASSEGVDNKIGDAFVISMYNFAGNSTVMFREALRDFINSGSGGLVLDLRNNPGGYLEAAIDIASWFLPAGKIVAIEKFSDGKERFYRSKGYDIFEKLPMVVLVNEGSASASEILAGALQEHGIATIVGEKTFGKGSVQELVTITPETSLKITIAHWLTPNGKSISDNGLDPDVVVEITKEDFENERDPQLKKAIEILNKNI